MPIMLLAVCANINSELQPHNVLHSLVYNIDKFHSKLVCVGLAPIISLSPSIIKVQVEYDGRKLQFYFLCPCVWKGCAAAWCCGAILIVKFSGTFIWRASFTHQYKIQRGMHCTAAVQNHHPNYYRMLYGVGGDSCCKGRVQMEVGLGLGHRAGANGDTVGQWSSGRGGTKGEVYLE